MTENTERRYTLATADDYEHEALYCDGELVRDAQGCFDADLLLVALGVKFDYVYAYVPSGEFPQREVDLLDDKEKHTKERLAEAAELRRRADRLEAQASA